jgi:hypothetical protein
MRPPGCRQRCGFQIHTGRQRRCFYDIRFSAIQATGSLPWALFEKLNELTQMMSARKTRLYFNALLSLRLARMCKKS